jgi:hypothetical protein
MKEKSPHIVKVKPVGDKRETYGYEVKHIDFTSPWSPEGGPEVTSKFFLSEEKAKEYAATLKPYGVSANG